MNSILAQNFFLYMWTTLEDLFGCEIISWMNGEDMPPVDSLSLPPPVDDESSNYMDPNEHRQVLSTTTQNVAHSLATLLYRAVQQAEKSVELSQLFQTDRAAETTSSSSSSFSHSSTLFSSEEGRRYHQAKQTLLARAEIRRANPSFNSMQWNFLGLLLVDALVLRKVLCLTGDYSPVSGDDDCPCPEHTPAAVPHHRRTNEERAGVWSALFSRSVLAVLGGKEVRDSVLEPREMQNLRSFFHVDSN
jgi:hypothetical protein